MVEEPVATARCLEVMTRDVDLDRLLEGPLHPGVTRSTLDRWGLGRLRDDAALVVSELVTNAVRYLTPPGAYGDRPITLMLLRREPHVLLSVSDPSDGVPAPKEPDFISEHGRGLYIVETYSDRWGWNPLSRGGKAVWALFHCDL
jgi:anti-sigma regulatory factor (Ser/Thr protein kinase)